MFFSCIFVLQVIVILSTFLSDTLSLYVQDTLTVFQTGVLAEGLKNKRVSIPLTWYLLDTSLLDTQRGAYTNPVSKGEQK